MLTCSTNKKVAFKISTVWEACYSFHSLATACKNVKESCSPAQFLLIWPIGGRSRELPPHSTNWLAERKWCCPIRATLQLTKVSSGDLMLFRLRTDVYWNMCLKGTIRTSGDRLRFVMRYSFMGEYKIDFTHSEISILKLILIYIHMNMHEYITEISNHVYQRT